jgi:hypothetical protein
VNRAEWIRQRESETLYPARRDDLQAACDALDTIERLGATARRAVTALVIRCPTGCRVGRVYRFDRRALLDLGQGRAVFLSDAWRVEYVRCRHGAYHFDTRAAAAAVRNAHGAPYIATA